MANESKAAGKIITTLIGVTLIAIATATITGMVKSAAAEARTDAIEAKVDVNTKAIETIKALVVSTNEGVGNLTREVVVLQTLVSEHTKTHQR